MIAYSSITTSLIGTLTFYHLYIVSRGITTNEDIRNKFGDAQKNPYDKGLN